MSPPEKAQAARARSDCQEDRRTALSIRFRFVFSPVPDAKLIRAVGAENQGHWSGTIAAPITYVVDPNGKVRWAYASASAADRPSPVALAKAAVSIAHGKVLPADYPGKS